MEDTEVGDFEPREKRKYFPQDSVWERVPDNMPGDGPYRLQNVPWLQAADGDCL